MYGEKTMIKINEIMFYGRYFDNGKQKYNNYWWYSKADEKLFSIEEIMQSFNYGSEVEISESDIFIPLFKVNIYSLEKAFISDLNNKEISKKFKSKDGEMLDISFLQYIEREPFIGNLWFDYERKHLSSQAENWCKENHIPYKI